MNRIEIEKYHFNNMYGDSDVKIHEDYWYELLPKDVIQLKDFYKCEMLKAGSWNSNELGRLNAIIKILNENFPDWRKE